MRFGKSLLFCARLALPIALNTPEAETAEIEVLVIHPTLGKCPAIRIPIFPREDQKMLDWKVTGDLVFWSSTNTAQSKPACSARSNAWAA